MGLLAPLFLLGALAAAVPILLHLRRRERRNIIVFPSLMFLRGAPPPQASRRRLHNLLLLTLRVAIVLLLALAFARPVLERVLPEGLLDGGRDVVILLDRSPSMRVSDRMVVAKREALGEIDRLDGRDRAAVVSFDDRAVALTEFTSDRRLLRSVIEQVEPGGGTTRYAPALQIASRLLADGEGTGGEVVLIGDLQNVGWSPGESGLLPAGSILRVTSVGERGSGAVRAPPVRLASRSTLRGDRELATVSLRASVGADWRLEVDGREAGRVATDSIGDGIVSADFPALPLPERALRARVPLPEGGPDDAVRLVLARGRAPDVAVVRSARTSDDGYIATALRASDSPPISVTVWRGNLPSDRELSEIAVLVLDDATLGSGDAERLLRWVERGGGLVLGLGPDAAELPAPLAAAAGLSRASLVERPNASVAMVDASHPAFAGARGTAVATLPGAALWRYYRLSPPATAATIARSDDGSAILIEQRMGRGNLLAWASTFDARWNEVVRHPAFVPLVHAIALAAAGGEPPPASIESGAVVDLASLIAASAGRGAPPADGERLTLAAPGDVRREVIVHDGSAIARLDQAGFHEVRRESGSEDALVLAVNVPEEEWIEDRLTSEVIIAAISSEEEVSPRTSVIAPAKARVETERRQRLWWWLLAAAGLLLAAEGALANRLARPYVASQVNGSRG